MEASEENKEMARECEELRKRNKKMEDTQKTLSCKLSIDILATTVKLTPPESTQISGGLKS